jgi:hypothetical protein
MAKKWTASLKKKPRLRINLGHGGTGMYQMTAPRQAALKKAQMASAAKRKGRKGAVALRLDSFTKKHFKAWGERTLFPEHRKTTMRKMVKLLKNHPTLIKEGRSWTEIRDLAER